MPRACGGCGILVSFDPAGDYISFTNGSATDIVNGQTVTFSIVPGSGGSMPAGLVAGTRYMVQHAQTLKFQVGAIPGGALINIGSGGSHVQLESCTGP